MSFLFTESSQAARHGGCFPPESTVLTESGAVKKLSELLVGDRVQSMNEQGQLVFSPVLLFLDRDLNDQRQFVQLQSADGAKVTLTASHLIYTVAASQDLLEDVDVGSDNFQQQMNEIERVEDAEEENRLLDRLMVNVTVGQLGSRLRATFASKVQIGDWIVTTGRDGRPVPQRVVDVSAVVHQGVLAPLTDQGTLVVDQVVVSCYAVIDNQAIAHWAFAPIRLANNVREGFIHFWRTLNSPVSASSSSSSRSSSTTKTTNNNVGIHWYAQMLYRIARFVLPSHLVFN